MSLASSETEQLLNPKSNKGDTVNNLDRQLGVELPNISGVLTTSNNSLVEFGSYYQYLSWIKGHAVVEYFMRVLPAWNRWKAFHRFHSNNLPIMTINYGHPASPESSVAYFFA